MKPIAFWLIVAWASCVQASPERFAEWLVTLMFLKFACTNVWWAIREQPPPPWMTP